MREEIIKFCDCLGGDPLRVQGAGGNVSWKEGKTLHIKASGTWLARAKEKNIFVPVDLEHLQSAIDREDFAATPEVCDSSGMKPSIETMLHAVMPQKIVAHLHLVDAIARLVRKNYPVEVPVRGRFAYALVDYHKPGAELAEALYRKIKNRSEIDVVLLKNHGIIAGGESAEELLNTIEKLEEVFRCEPRPKVDIPAIRPIGNGYRPVPCPNIQQLVFDKALFQRLSKDWALYPDHVVFLGERPHIYHSEREIDDTAEIIFLKNRGIFTKTAPTPAVIEQLLCYYNVMARQHPEEELVSLSSGEIAAVLNWDAERYRQGL